MEVLKRSQQPLPVLLEELRVDPKVGLPVSEAVNRLSQFGPNQIAGQVTTWWQIFIRQLKSPFLFLLLVAAALAFILGERIDSLLIFLFVLINTVLGFFQEFHSQRTLQLLKAYLAHKTKVLRDGKEVVVESSQVVVGDIVFLAPGDAISADLRLLEAKGMAVDESALTGESVPVGKTLTIPDRPISQTYQARNMVFSGTTVVSGKGKGVVVATGKETVFGTIGKLALETVRISGFEKNISKLSRFILQLVVVTLTFLVLANLVMKGNGAGAADLLIFAIALAVSVIPEALPVVITFSLSQGALRLAKNKVVVKRLSAIEDLGGIEILCTDKTGTLTENQMEVAALKGKDQEQLLSLAGLAASIFTKGKEPTNTFDQAIYQKLDRKLKASFSQYQPVSQLPFDPQRRRDSVLVEHYGRRLLLVRGAPEVIFKACRLKQAEREQWHQWFVDQGRLGRRVLAIGKRELTALQEHTFSREEKKLELVGLIAFADPLKKTAAGAVKKAAQLGVSIKVLTGDTREVAGAIARKLGLVDSPKQIVSGEEWDKLSDSQRHAQVKEMVVFARVSPQQKYAIIQLLEETHEVGFLGEGINDAPALKVANVALVVKDAADISRDAADIILLKKDLGVIVNGIEEGRKVFANTTKYITATLASNFGNFFAIAAVSLFIDFLPMLPVQILLLNLLSDFPMIAIATDTVDPQELARPRTYKTREIAFLATVLGVVSMVFDFLMFSVLYRISPLILQTGWFMGSVLTELVFLFSIRTRLPFFKAKAPSPILWLLTGIGAVATVVLPLTNFGREVFHFVALARGELLAIGLVVVVYFGITEVVKLLYYRMNQNHQGDLAIS